MNFLILSRIPLEMIGLEVDIFIKVVEEKVLLHSLYPAVCVAVSVVMLMIPPTHVAVKSHKY